jgi:hypothetical protein
MSKKRVPIFTEHLDALVVRFDAGLQPSNIVLGLLDVGLAVLSVLVAGVALSILVLDGLQEGLDDTKLGITGSLVILLQVVDLGLRGSLQLGKQLLDIIDLALGLFTSSEHTKVPDPSHAIR